MDIHSERSFEKDLASHFALKDLLADAAQPPPPNTEASLGKGLVWRHPCFLDASGGAEFVSPSCLAEEHARLQHGGLGLAMPLTFAAELLEAARPALPSHLASPVLPALHALRAGARLAKNMPVGVTSRRALLDWLKALVAELRSLAVGAAIVLPVSSAGQGTAAGGLCSVLLVLRRDEAAWWSLAVCTASDGAEYHPHYPVPLRASPDFDPCLFLRGVPGEKVLDSAVWVLLYGRHGERRSSARTLYEVVLPFLHERPLPASLAAWPLMVGAGVVGATALARTGRVWV